MKIFGVIVLLFTTILSAEEDTPVEPVKKTEIVPKPPNGMKSADSHDLGLKFLNIIDQQVQFPERNDWGKNKITRYISSGRLGHSITIYGVLDDARQIVILKKAQEIVDQGDFGRVYVEFRGAEQFADAGGGWQARTGEKTLRSRIITKTEKVEAAKP